MCLCVCECWREISYLFSLVGFDDIHGGRNSVAQLLDVILDYRDRCGRRIWRHRSTIVDTTAAVCVVVVVLVESCWERWTRLIAVGRRCCCLFSAEWHICAKTARMHVVVDGRQISVCALYKARRHFKSRSIELQLHKWITSSLIPLPRSWSLQGPRWLAPLLSSSSSWDPRCCSTLSKYAHKWMNETWFCDPNKDDQQGPPPNLYFQALQLGILEIVVVCGCRWWRAARSSGCALFDCARGRVERELAVRRAQPLLEAALSFGGCGRRSRRRFVSIALAGLVSLHTRRVVHVRLGSKANDAVGYLKLNVLLFFERTRIHKCRRGGGGRGRRTRRNWWASGIVSAAGLNAAAHQLHEREVIVKALYDLDVLTLVQVYVVAGHVVGRQCGQFVGRLFRFFKKFC